MNESTIIGILALCLVCSILIGMYISDPQSDSYIKRNGLYIIPAIGAMIGLIICIVLVSILGITFETKTVCKNCNYEISEDFSFCPTRRNEVE